MVGKVVSEDEWPALLDAVKVFRFSVEKNLTYFLEAMSRHRTVVNFLCRRSELLHRREDMKLDKIFAQKYNGIRQSHTGKLGKAPPAEALKQMVKGDPEYISQLQTVSNAEFNRDLLRDLRDTLATKSREVDQMANNMRLEVRFNENDER